MDGSALSSTNRASASFATLLTSGLSEGVKGGGVGCRERKSRNTFRTSPEYCGRITIISGPPLTT
ncbi:hypothetical protein M422DRAFT_25294 [Sphaerobolus stellatus SS14]|uniref:Unplaced genomic scaffold SPHSTscaffold_353, whole genome shotgun sequence n=1 Tax=Sphaerobolus stellatus (strain SS14) TaxID=990650 RepID=A0A0C9UIW7_SPHS4|nr:hypothetical protein M422DRAFT_38898 [Sphaerobolus stellatus SS14]KIJ54376.1 hypothetical protein M422DRAFT_25294 [Sphaerobolus stellatus SS14]